MRQHIWPICVLLVCGMWWGLSGCGGGASTVPKVVVRPAQEEAGSPKGNEPQAKDKTSGTEQEPVAGGVGTLRGRFIFDGEPPQLPPLVTKGNAPKDKEVCAAEMDIPDESLIVDPQTHGIKNVFIYLDRAPKGDYPKPSQPFRFDQKNCIFTTHAMIVRVGVPVLILNSDPIAHNTHTFPRRNEALNQLLKQNDQKGVPLVYTRPESVPVEVKCDLHAWMRAFQLPLDHPFGAVSAADGSFEIRDLPSGKYAFKIWHERAVGGFLNRRFSVTVKPGENEPLEIKYQASDFGL
ncbi:MAG: hypothetical protein D6725_03395 [Planctomycetota bacterium]|nr:MAG: hypothetical protein D6725_03395 [Planctomycetota bacterium]